MAKGMYWDKIDLVRYGIDSLQFNCRLPIDSVVGAQMEQLLDENERFMSFTSYSRSRVVHILWESVRKDEEGSFWLTLRLWADPNSGDRPPTSLSRSSDLGDLLGRLYDETEISWTVDFEFPQKQGAILATAFPLPFSLSRDELTDLPFDEIVGVRGIKASDDKSDLSPYEFILDRPTGDLLSARIMLDTKEALTTSMLSAAASRSERIARRLVITVKE